MVDKVSAENMSSDLRHLYALKDFVASQQPILEKELVKEYAAVLEKYIEDHEEFVGGLSYSLWMKASRYSKISEPTLRINLRKGNFNNYWAGFFNKIAEETMPEWTDNFIGDISTVYNSLKAIRDTNLTFLDYFDKKDIVNVIGIFDESKTDKDYLVDGIYLSHKENMSSALVEYNIAVQALVRRMDEIGLRPENLEGVADDFKKSIDESNECFKMICDSEDRRTVLSGAVLLEEYLGEVQKNVNVCLTDVGDDFKFYDHSLINLDTDSFMGMLYRLKHIKEKEQEFKARALEHLDYKLESFDAEVLNPYASIKVAVRGKKSNRGVVLS